MLLKYDTNKMSTYIFYNVEAPDVLFRYEEMFNI